MSDPRSADEPPSGPQPDVGRRSRIRAVHTELLPTAAAFMRTEAASGVVLLAAIAVAMVWANWPAGNSYLDCWHREISFQLGGYETEFELVDIVNGGLMTLFFYLVGLEIKRELVEGELARPGQAVLPVAAAVGGMAAPALI